MYVSLTHNGIGQTLHGIHCGWGHDMGHTVTYDTVEELMEAEEAKGATDRHYTPQQVEASVDAICDEVQRRKAKGGGDAQG